MKRILSLILVLALCLPLCGCSGTNLTLDNYDDYLKVRAYCGGANEIAKSIWLGEYYNGYRLLHDKFCTALGGSLYVESFSPNFIYNDVTITVRFTGTAYILPENSGDLPTLKEHPFTFTETFELTTGGTVKAKDATEEVQLDLPSGYMMIRDPWDHFDDEGPDYTWEIIAISGTVSKA